MAASCWVLLSVTYTEGPTSSKVEVAYDLVLNTENFQNRMPDYYFVRIQLAKALNLDFWGQSLKPENEPNEGNQKKQGKTRGNDGKRRETRGNKGKLGY